MKLIKMLAEMIRDELDDAEKYAKCAVKLKDEDQRLADMFYALSKAEMDHASTEHEQAQRLIKEFPGEAPVSMQAVWDWEHEKMIDHVERIKRLQEMYKE